MALHSSTLAWKIPWMEEPGRLQSMRSLRVRHDWTTSLSLFTFMHWRRKWQPTPVFLPGESQGRGAWWLPSMGLHRVRHDWSDLAAAATAFKIVHFPIEAYIQFIESVASWIFVCLLICFLLFILYYLKLACHFFKEQGESANLFLSAPMINTNSSSC